MSDAGPDDPRREPETGTDRSPRRLPRRTSADPHGSPPGRTGAPSDEPVLAPEQYELREPPRHVVSVNRRELFRVLGGGLAVALVLGDAVPLAAQESGRAGRGQGSDPEDVASWIHVGADGGVTVMTGKVEVGQNIRTSLSQAVAEELHVPVASIRMIMGDTDLTPYDRGTFGSQTTPRMAPILRRAAVATREAILDLAAETWGAERTALRLEDGRVVNPGSGRSAGIGELVDGQEIVRTIASEDALAHPSEWAVAGSTVPKVDGEAFVTGVHEYPSDVRVDGMQYGQVLRPPAFGATLASVDLSGAEVMAGVTVVRDGDFIGAVAASQEEARAAVAAIRADWSTSPQPSHREIFDHLARTAETGGGGRRDRSSGSVEEGLAAAATRLEATYEIAYIAHAPLEPRAAVAEWTEDGRLTVWTGTQRPFGVRGELAEAFRLPEERVRVIMPDTGSGYGGKHTGETAVEAARLARVAGVPVRLVWSREEEFTWAYFRPAGVIRVRSGAGADGRLTAWEFVNINSGGSGIATPYEVANQDIRFRSADSPLRQGSYRGLAAAANHFAREVHLDELAGALGVDPLELRLRNLQDERLRDVLVAAADAFGWQQRPAAGPGHRGLRGSGLAVGTEKGSVVATCAEVAVDPSSGEVAVVRAVTAFECGAIVNPDQLRNQVEGAVVQGIGGALFEAVEFEDGRILNASFSRYRVPRFSDMPEMETVLLDRPDRPSAGAGETPIVGIAPAIGNAIFDATGQRLRSMPLAPEGVTTTEVAAGRDGG